jgi:hypothetical protein
VTKPIITKQMLIDADACPNQVDLFERTFGDSVVVTVKRAEKVAHLFDWAWATRFLDAQGRAKYTRARVAALDEYIRATAPTLAEYERGIADAFDDRVKKAAWAEYERVIEAAWAEYDRAAATVWATAFIDMHKRGASA